MIRAVVAPNHRLVPLACIRTDVVVVRFLALCVIANDASQLCLRNALLHWIVADPNLHQRAIDPFGRPALVRQYTGVHSLGMTGKESSSVTKNVSCTSTSQGTRWLFCRAAVSDVFQCEGSGRARDTKSSRRPASTRCRIGSRGLRG